MAVKFPIFRFLKNERLLKFRFGFPVRQIRPSARP